MLLLVMVLALAMLNYHVWMYVFLEMRDLCIHPIFNVYYFYHFQVAHLVAEEFFQQGDLEQKELNVTPIVSNVVPA